MPKRSVPTPQPDIADLLLYAAEAEECRRSFKAFALKAWDILEPGTPLKWAWFHDAICEHLQALYEGQIHRLVISIAPGHTKSTLVSQIFPMWVWTNRPTFRWLCASTTQDLAIRDNRNSRYLAESEWYRACYGREFRVNQTQFDMSADVNMKCLLGSTKIHTDHGELAIQDIVEQKMNVRVLTFNHEKSKIENNHILAYEKLPGRPCVKVVCSNGATVVCTSNHPFYVHGKGYVEAQFLQVGETVYGKMLVCEVCGKEYRLPSRSRKVGRFLLHCCSRECQKVWIPEEIRAKRICIQCGAYIPVAKGQTKTKPKQFCSYACKGEWTHRHIDNRITLVCQECGKEFLVYPANKHLKYCSPTCYHAQHHWKTDGQWRGPYGKNFGTISRRVRKRDGNQCMLCHSTVRLEVHHIDHDKQNNSETNLITLCQPCHQQETHSKNREEWKKQLSSLLFQTYPHLLSITSK